MIVVLGVMGGLQDGYIESILQISSFHGRVVVPADKADQAAALIRSLPGVSSAVICSEIHVVAIGPSGQTMTILLRGLEPDSHAKDPSLVIALGLPEKRQFPLPGKLVIGKEAATMLGLGPNSSLKLFGVRQTESDGAIPVEISVPFGQTFNSGYYEFDASMGFITLGTQESETVFPQATRILGIKFLDRYSDFRLQGSIESALPPGSSEYSSWRVYNRSFFGALRTEKTIMMLLISLIFLVVGINIFHAMRRTIAAKKGDIAILKSCGARDIDIQRIFILDGFSIGLMGSLLGIGAGLGISLNINFLANRFAAGLRLVAQLLSSLGIGGGVGEYGLFSPINYYLDSIPVSISAGEIGFIALMAILSTTASALLASKRVSEARPSEVFRNE
ncbi:MAG: lipoprotein-releasing system permease protein [Spirochaetes bacterium]|nr:MAG: lipoprotein-releasing system permease protein [Spirochaetota bacterium]